MRSRYTQAAIFEKKGESEIGRKDEGEEGLLILEMGKIEWEQLNVSRRKERLL